MMEAEREMMNIIHMYGLILSLDGGAKKAALDCIKAIWEDEQS